MEFKKYQHIEKLGSSEVEGILQGTVYIFYKIDGTNGCVWLDNGELKFGSRTREVSLEKDNANFMKSIVENKDLYNSLKKYLTLHPEYIIYGEWLVPHTLRTYNQNAWKNFYIFDVYDTRLNQYVPYNMYSSELAINCPNLRYIPLLQEITNPTEGQLRHCLEHSGDWLVSSGLGEGIVIKNYDYVNKYGRTTWAKMLTEDFLGKKKSTRQNNKELNESENRIEFEISKMMTVEHILKEKSKIEESHDGWSDKYIFELLNRAFNEFWRDNWEIILKKYRYPTINFRVLKQLCDAQVKKVLNI